MYIIRSIPLITREISNILNTKHKAPKKGRKSNMFRVQDSADGDYYDEAARSHNDVVSNIIVFVSIIAFLRITSYVKNAVAC